MLRTMWEWLGIAPTTDKALIRKAYAEQAKKYHPEEFPEEAQRLREAYKKAMALAAADKGNMEVQGSAVFEFSTEENRFRGEESAGKQEEGKQEEKAQEGYHYTPKREEPEREVPAGAQEENDKFEYHYHSFEPAKEERVLKLVMQMIFVYESSDYRWVPKIWRMVFRNHPVREDFRDPFVVSELISAIEQMPGLEWLALRAIRKELLRYSGSGPVWSRHKSRLEERLKTVKKELRAHDTQYTGAGLRALASQELYGKDNIIYKRHMVKKKSILAAVLIMGLLAFIMAAVVNLRLDERQEERERQEVIDSWMKEIQIQKR